MYVNGLLLCVGGLDGWGWGHSVLRFPKTETKAKTEVCVGGKIKKPEKAGASKGCAAIPRVRQFQRKVRDKISQYVMNKEKGRCDTSLLESAQHKTPEHLLEEENTLTSPLLKLPAELRNAIFKFTYDDTVYMMFENGAILSSSTSHMFTCLNNTHFASRQLHREKFGLEYKVDKRRIMSGDVFTTLWRAQDWRLKDIKKLEITGLDLNENPDAVILDDMIIKTAWEQPEATIIVQVPGLRFQAKHVKKRQRRKDVKELNAPNLRSVPPKPTFDEDELRRLVTQSNGAYIKNMLLTVFKNDIEELVKEVKIWHKMGL
ncbi:hypothetical protein CC86DRAFT_463125 [Ophiobolus disseminans]|uniref:Uncharacterized protein n=1 Tax=Ophiobolus disseminans TaxID=1469910 RepID=A0A6A7AF03_9PLEO|nr:hypothetical protein CC86DRAFT_463125 [Ophiobolus disseminans]